MRQQVGKLVSAAAAAWLLLGAGSAGAATAMDYNVFAGGTFSSQNTEVNGALAVGGSAAVSSFSVGSGLPSNYGGASLVVGGSLSYTNGQVFHGNAVVGGSIAGSGFTVLAPGTKTQNASSLPVNFGSEVVRLKDLSTALKGLAANGTVSGTSSLVFTGSNANVNVFNVTAAQLAGASSIAYDLAPGSVALFNVSGTSVTTNWLGFTSGGTAISQQNADLASPLLFNFADASNITFNGSWAGTVLAPNANVSLNWGANYGSLYANNIISSSEFYNVRFSGYERLQPQTLPVPEPATWAMMLIGFGLAGAAIRGRRAVPAAA